MRGSTAAVYDVRCQGANWSVTLLEIVPNLAVTVAVALRRMDRALTVKLPEVDPTTTVTDDVDVLSRFELSDRATVTLPDRAGLVRVTVQVVVA